MKTPDYNKRALKELSRFYRESEIEEFLWYTDYEDDKVYELRFIDNHGVKRIFSIDKKTNNPTLKNM